jgi:hypothetical protein
VSASRRELAAMSAAGWEIQTFTFADRLRAWFGRRRPVGRAWEPARVSSVGRWSA